MKFEDIERLIASTQFAVTNDKGEIKRNTKLEEARRALEVTAAEYKEVNPDQLGINPAGRLLLGKGLQTHSLLGYLYVVIAESEEASDLLGPAILEQPVRKAEGYRKKAKDAYHRAIEFARALNRDVTELILKREELSPQKIRYNDGKSVINHIIQP